MNNQIDVSAGIRALKIIILSMVTANAMFLIIALFVAPLADVDPRLSRFLFPLLLVLAAATVLVPPLLNRLFLGSARAQIGPAPAQEPTTIALPHWQKLILVRGAMAESLGLFATVVFLLTESWSALAVTVAAIVLLVARMPTRASLDRFTAAATPTDI